MRDCVLEQKGTWDSHLPLIEFMIKALKWRRELYGRRYRTPLCWYESSESVILGLEIGQLTIEKVKLTRDKNENITNKEKKATMIRGGKIWNLWKVIMCF